MARRSLPPELFAKALARFREDPALPHAILARELGGLDPRTITSWWKRGFKGHPAISETIAEDARRARSLVASELAAEDQSRAEKLVAAERAKSTTPEVVQADAALQRARQGAAARGLLDQVEQARGIGDHLLRYGKQLVVWLEAQPIGPKMTTSAAISELKRAGEFLRIVGESVDNAIRLERLVLGDPDQIIEIQSVTSAAELHASVARLNSDLAQLETEGEAAEKEGPSGGTLLQ